LSTRARFENMDAAVGEHNPMYGGHSRALHVSSSVSVALTMSSSSTSSSVPLAYVFTLWVKSISSSLSSPSLKFESSCEITVLFHFSLFRFGCDLKKRLSHKRNSTLHRTVPMTTDLPGQTSNHTEIPTFSRFFPNFRWTALKTFFFG